MEQIVTEFKDRIGAAAANSKPLRLRGGGSKDWYGQAPQGELLETGAYRGILAYEPTELVITARCATPLAEIDAALAGQNQMLAFEPPHFGPGATVGGMLACGLSGPRRQAVGALRDFVLGAVLMDGRGDILRFGGQVMKNVAGYDVSRMMAGSFGTLGLILQASLKVLPKPSREATVRIALDQAAAIEQINRWSGLPMPISASAWVDGVLAVRLSGAHAAVEAARRTIGGDSVDDADALWLSLREQQHAFFSQDPDCGLWRFGLPSATPPLALPGAQLIEWGGAQRWLKTDADPAALRAMAARLGGHATLFRGGDKSAGVFQPLAPAVAAIHRNLKQAFDPAAIFNPGRLYNGL